MPIDNEKMMLQTNLTSNYPRITTPMVEFFRQVQNSIKLDPNYLQHLSCPYDPRVRGYLEELFQAGDANSIQIEADVKEYFGEGVDDKTYHLIVRDAKRAYLMMSKLGLKIEDSNRPDEQLTRVKTLAQLQERLLAIVDKAEGFKQIHQFKRVVLDAISSALTPDQRTQIMEQINESLKA